jgi:hypothetical protein
MADSDQILQLGIDEARNGNREAARNLFELLTRQEPDNAQAWLWLAGVADGPDQRREALQRVLRLDPSNDMARKGLQAMGVDTAAVIAAAAPVPAADPVPAAPARSRSADEAFADELDSAFDMDYEAVPRAVSPPRNDSAAELAGVAADSPGSTSRRTDRTDRPADRPTLRRPSPRVRTPVEDDDDEDDGTVSRGPNQLTIVLIAAIFLLGLGYIIFTMFFSGSPQNAQPAPDSNAAVGVPTADPAAPAPTLDPAAPAPTTDPAAQPTADPAAPAPTADPAAQPTADPAAQPTAVPAPAPAGPDPAQANPAPVAVGTTLQADGWSYTYPQANYAVVLGKTAAGQTAQGNYVHVLTWIANNTGTSQAIPADFFVIKDAQGRVHTPQVKLSSALVNRGVNADVGMEDNIPANGVTTSIYLVFDIPSGATDLTLFARNNPSQGFKLNLNIP